MTGDELSDGLQIQLLAVMAQKDGAYLERNRCVALIARMAIATGLVAGTARTPIEGWAEDWHGCVFIDLPTGQASWHYHDSQAQLFAGLPPYTGAWDGHDTPEKYRRVGEAFVGARPVVPGAMAMKAVLHLVRQLKRDPRLAWLIGPGSESYDLLTAAAATTTGLDAAQLRANIERNLQTSAWPQPRTEREFDEGDSDLGLDGRPNSQRS